MTEPTPPFVLGSLIPPLGTDLPTNTVEIEVVGKEWWKSKTVWFNVSAASLEALQLIGTLGIVPPGTITTVTAFINIILRRLTTQPLKTAHPRMVVGVLKPTPDSLLLQPPPEGLPPWMRR